MKTSKLFLSFFLFSFCVQSILGQNIIDVSDKINSSIGKKITHFYDESRKIKIDEISDSSFVQLDDEVPNFGYNTGADWIKMKFTNSSTQELDRILRINKSIIDSIQLYHYKNGMLHEDVVGGLVNTNPSYKHSKSNYFHLKFLPKDTTTYYMRVVSMHSKQLAIHIETDNEYVLYEQNTTLAIGFYLGALLLITLYNLFLGLSIRDPVYLLYACSNLGALLATLALKGFFTGYLFYDKPLMSLVLIPVFIISFSIGSSFFCIKMVEIRKYSPVVFYLFIGVIVFNLYAVASPLLSVALGNVVTFKLLSIGTFLFTVMAWISGIVAIKHGNRNAKYYLIGWTVGLIGVFLFVFWLNGMLPHNFVTDNLYMIGSFIEVLALSFALADRYNNVQFEKNKLKTDLKYKGADLALVIADNKMKFQFRQNLLLQIEKLRDEEGAITSSDVKSLTTDLKMQLETDKKLNYFENELGKINYEFESKIKELFPQLTQSEIEICYLVKLNLSNKEIANFRRISEGAIKVAKYRIRKKIGGSINTTLSSI